MIQRSFIILLILIGYSTSSSGQFWKKNKTQQVELSSDSVSIEISPINFGNINSYPAYRNEKVQRRLQKLDAAGDWETLYPELKEYVSKFGPLNFALQTDYIWQLAKLTEVFGSAEAAKPLYAMVLKHHRQDVNIAEVLARYDSLNTNKKEYYVPIDYYYELYTTAILTKNQQLMKFLIDKITSPRLPCL